MGILVNNLDDNQGVNKPKILCGILEAKDKFKWKFIYMVNIKFPYFQGYYAV